MNKNLLVPNRFRKKPDPPKKKLVGIVAIVVAGLMGLAGTIVHFGKEERARAR